MLRVIEPQVLENLDRKSRKSPKGKIYEVVCMQRTLLFYYHKRWRVKRERTERSEVFSDGIRGLGGDLHGSLYPWVLDI